MSTETAIPGVSSQLLALATYLELTGCQDTNFANKLAEIEHRYSDDVTHQFTYNDTYYYVASIEAQLDHDAIIEANGQQWAVMATKVDAPYHIFNDNKVMNELIKHSPKNHELLAINQEKHRVLFRGPKGLLTTFAFSAHLPCEISTYSLKGTTHQPRRDIIEMFSHMYMPSEDEMMVDFKFC